MPLGWRDALPAGVTRFLEQQVDGRGALDVVVAEDFKQGKAKVIRTVRVNGQLVAQIQAPLADRVSPAQTASSSGSGGWGGLV